MGELMAQLNFKFKLIFENIKKIQRIAAQKTTLNLAPQQIPR